MNVGFFVSIVGLLKISEIVSSFLTWAIASGSKGFLNVGVGYTVFVGLVGFVIAIFFLLLYLFEVYPSMFVKNRLEPIVNAFVALLMFIAGVVSGAQAGKYHWVEGHNESAASSFFAFLAMVFFIIDIVLYLFMPNTGRPDATTTTTTSNPDPNNPGHSDVPPQYTTANY